MGPAAALFRINLLLLLLAPGLVMLWGAWPDTLTPVTPVSLKVLIGTTRGCRPALSDGDRTEWPSASSTCSSNTSSSRTCVAPQGQQTAFCPGSSMHAQSLHAQSPLLYCVGGCRYCRGAAELQVFQACVWHLEQGGQPFGAGHNCHL